jgi:DNA-directed RNA polymerase specialized sigma24 family protein
MEDLELLDLWRAGDAKAGDTLFKRHFDSVYGFFETKCSGADVDELTQATFLACVTSRDHFRKESSFRTYLFTIARNELYRLLRTRYRRDAKLDFEHSSIAQLHYREELELEQLAEVFGVTNQVIRTRLSRARKLLRERLDKLAKLEADALATRADWAGRIARG